MLYEKKIKSKSGHYGLITVLKVGCFYKGEFSESLIIDSEIDRKTIQSRTIEISESGEYNPKQLEQAIGELTEHLKEELDKIKVDETFDYHIKSLGFDISTT